MKTFVMTPWDDRAKTQNQINLYLEAVGITPEKIEVFTKRPDTDSFNDEDWYTFDLIDNFSEEDRETLANYMKEDRFAKKFFDEDLLYSYSGDSADIEEFFDSYVSFGGYKSYHTGWTFTIICYTQQQQEMINNNVGYSTQFQLNQTKVTIAAIRRIVTQRLATEGVHKDFVDRAIDNTPCPPVYELGCKDAFGTTYTERTPLLIKNATGLEYKFQSLVPSTSLSPNDLYVDTDHDRVTAFLDAISIYIVDVTEEACRLRDNDVHFITPEQVQAANKRIEEILG